MSQRFVTYWDDYVIDWDDDDNPIYDTNMSHSDLVRRARNATGRKEIVSIDWYDTWIDDSNPRKPVERIRAKVILA